MQDGFLSDDWGMRCWSQVLWTVTGFYWKRFWGLDNTITKVAMVCVAAVALGSSTYAWFASNNSVKAKKMNVTATADVKFLEIQNVRTDFTGGTVAVNADKAGSKTDYKLSPVTPMELTATDKTGKETTVLDVKNTGTDGFGDGLVWK